MLYSGMKTYILDKGLRGPYAGVTSHNLQDLRKSILEDLAAERDVLLLVPGADTVLADWQIGSTLCQLLKDLMAEPRVTILASSAEDNWSAEDYVAGLSKGK